MKPLSFLSSVLFSIALVVAGAALASTLQETDVENIDSQIKTEESKTDESSAVPASRENALSIKLRGIRAGRGKILVMVFDDANAFRHYDYDKAVAYQEAEASAKLLSFDFPSLDKGPYAVFIHHDENGDYQFNQIDGYPTEGFAISGAKNKYDEPGFKRAAKAKGEYRIKLQYF